MFLLRCQSCCSRVYCAVQSTAPAQASQSRAPGSPPNRVHRHRNLATHPPPISRAARHRRRTAARTSASQEAGPFRRRGAVNIAASERRTTSRSRRSQSHRRRPTTIIRLLERRWSAAAYGRPPTRMTGLSESAAFLARADGRRSWRHAKRRGGTQYLAALDEVRASGAYHVSALAGTVEAVRRSAMVGTDTQTAGAPAATRCMDGNHQQRPLADIQRGATSIAAVSGPDNSPGSSSASLLGCCRAPEGRLWRRPDSSGRGAS